MNIRDLFWAHYQSSMNIHELMNIPEVFLELIILRPRHDEYSRPFFGLITSRQ